MSEYIKLKGIEGAGLVPKASDVRERELVLNTVDGKAWTSSSDLGKAVELVTRNAFSDIRVYEIGDIVVHNNKAYFCSTLPNINPGPFDENDWTLLTDGFVQRGVLYDNSVEYSTGDIVSENNLSYVAKNPTIGNSPQTSPENWALSSKSNASTYDINTMYHYGDIVTLNNTGYVANKDTNGYFKTDDWDILNPEKAGILWDYETQYKTGDIVTQSGFAYIALANSINQQPSINPNLWSIIVDTLERGGIVWDNATNYKVGDIISYNFAVYMATVDNVGSIPSGTSTDWQTLESTGIPEKGGILWDNTIVYEVGDIVSYDEQAYICHEANLDSTPGNNNPKWVLVSPANVGDMHKSIYDTDNSGVVDNAETVNGLTVETAVPANADFIKDAPLDGKKYTRKNKEWSRIPDINDVAIETVNGAPIATVPENTAIPGTSIYPGATLHYSSSDIEDSTVVLGKQPSMFLTQSNGTVKAISDAPTFNPGGWFTKVNGVYTHWYKPSLTSLLTVTEYNKLNNTWTQNDIVGTDSENYEISLNDTNGGIIYVDGWMYLLGSNDGIAANAKINKINASNGVLDSSVSINSFPGSSKDYYAFKVGRKIYWVGQDQTTDTTRLIKYDLDNPTSFATTSTIRVGGAPTGGKAVSVSSEGKVYISGFGDFAAEIDLGVPETKIIVALNPVEIDDSLNRAIHIQLSESEDDAFIRWDSVASDNAASSVYKVFVNGQDYEKWYQLYGTSPAIINRGNDSLMLSKTEAGENGAPFGDSSTTFGSNTRAVRDNSLAIGEANTGQIDSIFEIGNGTIDIPADAMRVAENGLIHAPQAELNIIEAGDEKTLITKEYGVGKELAGTSSVADKIWVGTEAELAAIPTPRDAQTLFITVA